MAKQVGIKIEGKNNVYRYFISEWEAEHYLEELASTLKEGQAIELKYGREHAYIDYDSEWGYDAEIGRLMWYVHEYLNY